MAKAYSEARIWQNQARPRNSFTRRPSLADAADFSRSTHATDPSRGRLNQTFFKNFALRCPQTRQKKIRDLEISLLSKSQPPTTLGASKNVEKPKRKKLKKLVLEISFSLFLLGFGGAMDLGTSKSVSS